MSTFILGLLLTTTECLATNIYFEARNQPEMGQIAVTHVVLNRARDPRFPDTPCAVIKQGRMSDGMVYINQCQFSWYCDGKPKRVKKEVWEQNLKIAERALNLYIRGVDYSKGSTFYHATYVNPNWARYKKHMAKIGDHHFYKWKHKG